MDTPPQSRCITLMAIGAAALLLAATPCLAANTQPAPQANDSANRPAKKSRSVKIKHQQNHSGESTAERDRRLYRECRGLPNAGACLGYTRR
ncbi:hypothetical protein [Alicycliphilus denitrificans]|uniref:hypothetical protein n=1 Tax=Alicycliphilus denitrificans TaxID=179636 RepID=UPI00384C74EA